MTRLEKLITVATEALTAVTAVVFRLSRSRGRGETHELGRWTNEWFFKQAQHSNEGVTA